MIGGGLAGMTACLELVRLGMNVRLYEASHRLGGKAGSDESPMTVDVNFKVTPESRLPKGMYSDHGYHLFPDWYVNMRRLWKEIGIDAKKDVFDGGGYRALGPTIGGAMAEFGETETADLRQRLAICELILQQDGDVDDLTLQAFLRSRDFHRDAHPILLDGFILNALTIGEAAISSRCVRDVFRQWLPVFLPPKWPALKGSLQQILINRLRVRIEQVAQAKRVLFGVHTEHALQELSVSAQGGPVVRIRDQRIQADLVVEGQPVVMAIPLERLRAALAPEAFGVIPEVARLQRLRANVFSGLDIHFTTKLPNVSDQHFRLGVSRSAPLPVAPEAPDANALAKYRISGFDISQHWRALKKKGNTVLQFVASDSKEMVGLGPGKFVDVLTTEIAKHIPQARSKQEVDFYVPHQNVETPLFVNEVGTWKSRPTSTAQTCPGLFFAGDFIRNPTDVASMEGAVRTGLMAAEAVRKHCGEIGKAVELLEPMEPSDDIMKLVGLYQADPVLARLGCFALLAKQAAKQAAKPAAESAAKLKTKPTARAKVRVAR